MSLVSDALKKAERDAARREAREKGLPEPLVAPGQPFRARHRARPAALALAVGVAALALAALGWLALGRAPAPPGTQSATPAGTGAASPSATAPLAGSAASEATAAERLPENEAASEAPAGPSGASPPDSSSPSPRAGSEGGSTPAREAALAPESPLGRQPSNEVHRRSEPAPPSLAPSAPSATNAAQPDPAAAPAAGSAERVFVRTAVLADGTEIRLGGIAWSSTAPLAYLNGRLLGVGEFAGAWRVERIERQRVVLTGDGGRLVLSLR